MKIFFEKLNNRISDWMAEHGDSPKADWMLSAVSFMEASFFPIPPSSILLSMVALGKRKRWIYLATLTTLTSVLGGLFGYIIGGVLYDTVGIWIINTYNLAEEVAKIGEIFADNAFVSIFIAALTPIPYKAFTISAGFFSINIIPFVVASLLGRGIRFFAVGYFAKFFGNRLSPKMVNYFAIVTFAASLIIIIAVFWSSAR